MTSPGAPPKPIDLERPLAGTLDGAACPHMSILLESVGDVPGALASFYGLGLRRNGWLFHRALPGQADSDRHALEEAGLDVPTLEREGRFEICELPVGEAPENWAQPWVPTVDRALERGFDAVWWSRFPIGPEQRVFELAYVYDRYWEACFHGRRAISLCVYIVGGLPEPEREARAGELRQIHDATLVVEHDRPVSVLPRRTAA